MNYYENNKNYISKEILEQNQKVGIRVHEIIDVYNKKRELEFKSDDSEEIKLLAGAYVKWFEFYEPKIILSEHYFYKENRRVDLVAYINNKYYLIDTKTYNMINFHEEDIKNQLLDYKNICENNDITIDRCAVLLLSLAERADKSKYVKIDFKEISL